MDVREKLVELIDQARVVNTEYGVCISGTRHIADHLIANGVTFAADINVPTKWISVKDSLPPYNNDVLVYRPNMAMKIFVDCYAGHYGEDDGEWYEGWVKYGTNKHNNPLITHWAYLPQPPKGDSDG